MSRRRRRNAGRAPLSQDPTRAYSEPGRYPVRRRGSTRAVVPMIEDLAALVRPEQLASVRRQVQPGEVVGVYRGRGDRAPRLLICGPDRAFGRAPHVVDDGWDLAGVVAITEDGEQSLPVLQQRGRAA